MIEPTRLCEREPNGFDAALIRAGRREAPSYAARKAAAAAGLAGAVLTSKASATGMAFKGIAGAAVKGMIAGALLTSVIVVVPRVAAHRASAPRRASAVAVPAPPHVVSSPVSSVERAPEPVAAVPVQSPPVADPRKRAPDGVAAAPPPSTTTSVVASGTRLADEVRAFEQAEASFRRGDVAAAVAALDRYDRDFARGALAPEAEVLRIELLDAQGHGAAARARAQAFLAARPEAPAARRLRNLIARSDDRRRE